MKRNVYKTPYERMRDEAQVGIENVAAKVDVPALDAINEIISAPTWSVGMLEDICSIVRSTGRPVVESEYAHH